MKRTRVDSNNEATVTGARGERGGESTVRLMAHRMSTIRWADLTYVFDGGRVVESGDRDSLISQRGDRFRSFCDAQNLAAYIDRSTATGADSGAYWSSWKSPINTPPSLSSHACASKP